VIDIGFTGYPVLAFMCLGTEQIGTVNLLDLFRLQVGFQHAAQIAN
jgi:hypothetical protein